MKPIGWTRTWKNYLLILRLPYPSYKQLNQHLMFVHKPFKICGAPEQLGLRYQCEWLTEVAQSKTVNPETFQWAPQSAAICFVPAAEVSNQKRWKRLVSRAGHSYDRDRPRSIFQMAKTLHSHHGCKLSNLSLG